MPGRKPITLELKAKEMKRRTAPESTAREERRLKDKGLFPARIVDRSIGRYLTSLGEKEDGTIE